MKHTVRHTHGGDGARLRPPGGTAPFVMRCATCFALVLLLNAAVTNVVRAGCGDHLRHAASRWSLELIDQADSLAGGSFSGTLAGLGAHVTLGSSGSSPLVPHDVPRSHCDGPACRRNVPVPSPESPTVPRMTNLRDAACPAPGDLSPVVESLQASLAREVALPQSGFPATIDRPPKSGVIL